MTQNINDLKEECTKLFAEINCLKEKTSKSCPFFKECGGKGNIKAEHKAHYVLNYCPLYNQVIF